MIMGYNLHENYFFVLNLVVMVTNYFFVFISSTVTTTVNGFFTSSCNHSNFSYPNKPLYLVIMVTTIFGCLILVTTFHCIIF